MAKTDKNFYLALAKDIYNDLYEPIEGFDWIAERLQEIAKQWHYSHKRMTRWANQDDSTRVFDKIFESYWLDEEDEDDTPKPKVTISLLTGERKVWQPCINS